MGALPYIKTKRYFSKVSNFNLTNSTPHWVMAVYTRKTTTSVEANRDAFLHSIGGQCSLVRLIKHL